MRRINPSILAAAAAVLVAAPIASAHPGHAGGGGFAAGAGHPVSGLDHVLAMVAVGLLAARLGGRAVWLLPAAFLALMAGGGLLAGAGVAVPAVEHGIAVSVVVLGVLLAAATPGRAPLPAVAAVVGGFAVFHGYAHVAEMRGADAAGYAAGFLLATATLHAVGIAIGLIAARAMPARPVALRIARLTGGAIAACGALIWLGVL